MAIRQLTDTCNSGLYRFDLSVFSCLIRHLLRFRQNSKNTSLPMFSLKRHSYETADKTLRLRCFVLLDLLDFHYVYCIFNTTILFAFQSLLIFYILIIYILSNYTDLLMEAFRPWRVVVVSHCVSCSHHFF